MISARLHRGSLCQTPVGYNQSKSRSLPRLNFLKKIGLIDNISGLRVKRAISFKELRNAFSLSYRIFLSNQYITPHFMGMRIREWEININTATFVAYDNQKIVAVLSLAPEIDMAGLPSESLYANEINQFRDCFLNLAEACNEVVDNAHRNHSIIIEFLRCVLAHSWYAGIPKVMAVTNKTHKTFYEFIFMRQIGEVKNYCEDHYDPVVLMCLDCDRLREYLSSPESDNGTADSFLRDYLLFSNPYIELVPEWDRKAQAAFKRQRIRERFLDEIRNTLVESVMDDMRRAPDSTTSSIFLPTAKRN